MTKSLKWGLLATGAIAKTFAKALAHSKTGVLHAVGSRSPEKAEAFGEELGIPNRYGSYEDLLADKDIDAVYIATPHPAHAEWCVKAAEAKKHILVEKPVALNHAQAMAVFEAARQHDVFLMEAFMYRCHPQTARLVELIRQGAIGEVRFIHAAFSFHAPFRAEGRLFANILGGGSILDVGTYCTSMARLIAGAALGADFAEPLEVKGTGHIGEGKTDEWAAAVLRFPGGIIAQLASGVSVNQDSSVRVYGSEGSLHVPTPWVPARDGGASTILLTRKGQNDPQEIVVETDQHLYALEADVVAQHLKHRQAPQMTWADSLGNMRTLDLWRQSFGLVYEDEQPGHVRTVTGRPLALQSPNNMKHATIEGLSKSISRLVMGVDDITFAPDVAAILDHYFEQGGNCFDTGHVYQNGACERALGAWVASRNIREDVVILEKGAHTPYCTPQDVTRQLKESLERLQSDHVDIYMLHRDNSAVPVGEFIDVLHEHAQAGRIKVFGVSNWPLQRIDEANAYAARNAKRRISAVSNQLSLARMVEPVWPGCVSVHEPDSRAWFARNNMPLMPWSSQARGFFIEGRAHPDYRDDEELVRCWYSDDNFERLQRATELAKKKNVASVNIALAWVLHQPFPTFPLIGPHQIAETRSSLAALDVELSPEEVKWLNLEQARP